MDEKFAEKLLAAIKADNLKEFESCMKQFSCGTFRLGRFPVLSLMYLYNSSKILAAYEEKFVKYNSWQEAYEPLAVAQDFRKVAGKSMRFYLEEVVSPVEMLMILDKTTKLKKVFPQAHMAAPVKQRLKNVYAVKYSLNVEYKGDQIVLDRRPRTSAEKKKLAVLVVCLVLCVAIFASTPFVINVFVPFIPNADGSLPVTKIEQIDFASQKTYFLKKDIVLPADFNVDQAICSIKSNGKSVTVLGKTPVFNNFGGVLEGVTVNTQGFAVINTLSYGGLVKNVTVNATFDGDADESFASLVNYNCATVQDVVVNVCGTLNFVGDKVDVQNGDSISCAAVVGTNYAVRMSTFIYEYSKVQNCTVNFDNLLLTGQPDANATFSGVVAINNGYVENCSVSGKISADTVDLAGISVTNLNTISNCKNFAELSQSTTSDQWNPVVAGIVTSNSGTVQGCQNLAKLCANSSRNKTNVFDGSELSCSVAGIVATNYSQVKSCKSSGDITATGMNVYLGGICAVSYFETTRCLASGNLSASGDSCSVGGIFGRASFTLSGGLIYFGSADGCVSQANILVKAPHGFVGGIVGLVAQGIVNETYYGGAVTNSFAASKCAAEGKCYVGTVVGACGKTSHDENVYFAGVEKRNNFANNFVVDNSFLAIAALFDGNDVFQTGDNLGATVSTMQQIKGMPLYKEVTEFFAE